eukprot:6183971-Pleurochrysis_carterae.AAC.6
MCMCPNRATSAPTFTSKQLNAPGRVRGYARGPRVPGPASARLHTLFALTLALARCGCCAQASRR